MKHSRTTLALALALLVPSPGAAQERGWLAEATIGYAGFVDDATKHFLVTGGGLRRYITPRLSIGPEVVTMFGLSRRQDQNVMLTGNVVFDASPRVGDGPRQITPFIVGGLGMFWSRTQVGTGPFWSSDPAFTAGVGLRARINRSVSVSAEYRIGWELHQRVTMSFGAHW